MLVKNIKKEYRENNREKFREAGRRYAIKYPERVRNQKKMYAKNNMDKIRESSRLCQRRRNAQKRGVVVGEIKLTKQQRLELQNWLCAICKCDENNIPSRADNRNGWEEDHIIPLSEYGQHADENLQILCWPCNLKKGDKILDEWFNGRTLGFEPRVLMVQIHPRLSW